MDNVNTNELMKKLGVLFHEPLLLKTIIKSVFTSYYRDTERILYYPIILHIAYSTIPHHITLMTEDQLRKVNSLSHAHNVYLYNNNMT